MWTAVWLSAFALANDPVPASVHERIVYANRDRQHNVLDLYVPAHDRADEPLPLLIWVHGGGWSSGSRKQISKDKAEFFTDRHAVIVSVDYRLSNGALDVDGTPIRFPDHSLDVADAIRWVIDHAADYGADPHRIALAGHSAGGHLVALAATDPRWLGAAREDIRCVAALDIDAVDIPTHMTGPGLDSKSEAVFLKVFGDDPATWAEASPITYLERGRYAPDFLLVHRGSPARRALVDGFRARLESVGADVTVVEAGEYDHGEVNSAIGQPGETIMTPPLARFFDRCLQAPPSRAVAVVTERPVADDAPARPVALDDNGEPVGAPGQPARALR